MPFISCTDAPLRKDSPIFQDVPFYILWLTVPLALYTMCCRMRPRPVFGSGTYFLLTVLWMVSSAYSADFSFFYTNTNTCVMGVGQVKCWGDVSWYTICCRFEIQYDHRVPVAFQGSHGINGNGETNDTLTPPVSAINLGDFPVESFGAGRDHVCAVSTHGETKCWGDGEYG